MKTLDELKAAMDVAYSEFQTARYEYDVCEICWDLYSSVDQSDSAYYARDLYNAARDAYHASREAYDAVRCAYDASIAYRSYCDAYHEKLKCFRQNKTRIGEK